MSRTWTNWGYTPKANEILSKKKKTGYRIITEYNLDGEVISKKHEDIFDFDYVKEEINRADVWYGREVILCRYRFEDGRVLEDYIQAAPWSSGPHTFLALRDVITKEPLAETLWPEETIDNV